MERGRVGVFGGTFDPPHVGHLVVATQARAQLGLDHLLFVPAGRPWQKTGQRAVTPAGLRLEMLQAACQGLSGVVVSDMEVWRPGPTYTIDTVLELGAPEVEVTLVLGADAAAGLPTWHRAEDLAPLVKVAWFDRLGWREPSLGDEWDLTRLDVPIVDVSSTMMRAWRAEGRPIDVLVPAGAVSIVERHGLYRGPG